MQVRADFWQRRQRTWKPTIQAHRYRHPKGPIRKILRLWGPSSYPGREALRTVTRASDDFPTSSRSAAQTAKARRVR